MMYDLCIRNATIVDGSGEDRFSGDVAVQDGLIVGVGSGLGRARRDIHADGRLLTPGWVDAHTHFDGQATWDPLVSPASGHGITTVVMGNCGVGFAPCRPGEHERLIQVMEAVEDIPGSALAEGLEWNWESFPEYLNVLESRPRALDVGAQVPHCAVRIHVMGERGVRNEEATADDISQMAAIVREGIQAGAIGFSTSRTELHTTHDGTPMPGTYAAEAELLGIGEVLGELGHGCYQLVSDFDDWAREMDWMKRLSLSTGRPVNFVLFFRKEEDFERVRRQLDYVHQANRQGAQLVAHVGARPVNILMGFEATVTPFMFSPTLAGLAGLSPEERYARLCDPAVRAQILADPQPEIEDPSWALNDFNRIYVLEDPPDYEPGPEKSIAALARKAGLSAAEYAYQRMLGDQGRELLYFPIFGYGSGDLSRQVEMIEDPASVISLADGGAHCGVLCDCSVPTSLLSYFVRDRQRGHRLPLEWTVHQQTRATAMAVGLADRGLVRPGFKADLNLIDFERLQMGRPRIVYDLPANGRRIVQDATGYVATVVSGEVTFEEGEHTGALPGRLVRGSRCEPLLASA